MHLFFRYKRLRGIKEMNIVYYEASPTGEKKTKLEFLTFFGVY